MNFKTDTTIIAIALFILITISSVFFFIFMKYDKELQLTKKEILGIYTIGNRQNLLSQTQNLRGYSQINIQQINKKIKYDVLSKLKKLNNATINKEIVSLEAINEEPNSSSLVFNSYTRIIKELSFLNLDDTDNMGLLFEGDRDLYFLIVVSFIQIPEAIENVAKIRGIGAGLLAKNKHASLYELKKHLDMYLHNISQIKNYIQKVNIPEARKISIQINNINTHLYYVNSAVKNIESIALTPEEYFSKTSLILKDLDNIFIASNDILILKLIKREHSIDNTINLGFIIYILLVIILTIALYIFQKKQKAYEKNILQKKDKEKFINNLRVSLEGSKNLKDICNTSLLHMIKLLNAVNGSLYLFDKRSSKLYLGAVYAINEKNLKSTLDLHDNILSENVLKKKIDVKSIEKTVNIGNIEIECNQIITIPLLDFDNSIGTIQLTFSKKSKNMDNEFLLEIATFMSAYIYKAQYNDETTSYLNLIDENTLMSKTDIRGNIKEVSQQLCTLSQYTKEELLGKNHRILRHPDTPSEIFKDLWGTISQGRVWKGELKNKKKDGSYYWIQSLITPDYDLNQNIIGYTAIRNDITDRKHIEEIAITDGLTGLYNRRHFDTIFPQKIEIAKRTNSLLVFVLIDIDNFKIYNDTYGHQDGDSTLQMVASSLNNTINRPNDYAFRLGGEEFGLLYFVKNEKDAYLLANKARENVEALQIEHSGSTASRYVTISSGFYIVAPQEKKSPKEIYKLCDNALYKAKESGRNKIISS